GRPAGDGRFRPPRTRRRRPPGHPGLDHRGGPSEGRRRVGRARGRRAGVARRAARRRAAALGRPGRGRGRGARHRAGRGQPPVPAAASAAASGGTVTGPTPVPAPPADLAAGDVCPFPVHLQFPVNQELGWTYTDASGRTVAEYVQGKLTGVITRTDTGRSVTR